MQRWPEIEKGLRRMKVYVDPCEVTLMEKAAANLRDRLLIRLLFRLGCRVSEALGLAIEDIDFGRSTVTIQHLKASLKLSCAECGQRLGRSHLFCPKCGIKVEKAQAERQERRRQRILPVDSDTLDMLREYVRRGGPVLRDGRKLIFGVNRHRGWGIVKGCAERAKLPKLVNPETGRIHNVSPHKLRDAFAVRAVKMDDSGDGLRLLQQHLGHASFNTTAKYRKVSGEEHKEWYEKLWEKEPA
jgi:integrase/recombinase XerD